VGYLTAVFSIQTIQSRMVGRQRNDKFEMLIRKWSWPNRGTSWYLPVELRKITKNLSQHSRKLGRDLNRAPPERRSRALTLKQPARSQNLTLFIRWQETSLTERITCSDFNCNFVTIFVMYGIFNHYFFNCEFCSHLLLSILQRHIFNARK
jgi:hypothetical protein